MDTIRDVLFANAAIDSARTAVIWGERRLTYADLRFRVARLARGLAANGVDRGARVAVLLGNRVEFVEAYLAITSLGALYVPLNGRLSASEHAAQLADAEPVAMIASPEHEASVELAVGVPSLRAIILVGAAGQGGIAYEQLVEDGTDDAPRAELFPADDAAIVYTSGTTSKPKGVVLTHGGYLADWRNVGTVVRPTRDSVNLQIAPLYHAAIVHSMIHLQAGGTTVLLKKFDPSVVLHAIAKYGVTHTFGVPTVIYDLIDHPDVRSTNLCSLKTFTYGAAPMTLQRLREAICVFGEVFIHAYGATETTSHCSILSSDEHAQAFGSVGRPLPLDRMKIVGERGRDVDDGSLGEIAVAGPNVMSRYWRNPGATAEALVDGWLMTGDIGRRDEAGFYYVADRKKDMIISGGVNIYPKDIEEQIARHPDVAEVAVFGVPDERWGEAVMAQIRPRPQKALEPSDIRAFLEGRLGRFQIPRTIEIVSDFPRNATGKILKHVLRIEAAAAQDGAMD